MPKCYILSGAPLSGKSTWAAKQKLPILSCDKIRIVKSGGKYVFDPQTEKEVWDEFYDTIHGYGKYVVKSDFIIDNTNCKEKYINKIKTYLHRDYEIEIVNFEVSYIKSYYRNITRWLRTGKWIPFKVINDMKRNYKQSHK